MWRSSFRSFFIARPASAASGSSRSASRRCFCAWSRSAEKSSAMPRSTYASEMLGCALITSRVVRSARSHSPNPSSALTSQRRVCGAFVFASMFAKNVRASEWSPLPIAASPSLCHASSCVARSRSALSALSPLFAKPSAHALRALSYSPSSECARASRLYALPNAGSLWIASWQSVMQSLKRPELK